MNLVLEISIRFLDFFLNMMSDLISDGSHHLTIKFLNWVAKKQHARYGWTT